MSLTVAFSPSYNLIAVQVVVGIFKSHFIPSEMFALGSFVFTENLSLTPMSRTIEWNGDHRSR